MLQKAISRCFLYAAAISLALNFTKPLSSSAAELPIFVPEKFVTVDDSFWTPRLETNRVSTIPHLFKENAENHRLDNLKRAAHEMDGAFVGRRYDDTDVFKLLEAVAYSLILHPDPELEKIADEQIDIIAKGQEPDGYIYAARTIDPAHPAPGAGPERFSREGGSHELYNMGHLIEAGVAYTAATGKPKFQEVAIKCADMLCRTFGPDKRHDTSGHEEIELALVKLYKATGQKKYLDLAQFFIDQRGQQHTFGDYEPGSFAMYNDRPYRQDDKPVIDQNEAEGHAVRAMYLYSGVTDVARLTGEPSYEKAVDRLWDSVVGRKMYITGGVGSVGGTEAFVADYILRNQSYCESCAAIGNALWNDRLFLLHGDAKYLDVMERITYNGLLSGISLKGDTFFYQNPLEASAGRGRRRAGGEGDDTGLSASAAGPRSAWFDVACCPANLARYVAQFPGYIYATESNALFVNFFVGSWLQMNLDGRPISFQQQSLYPWDGDVNFIVHSDAPSEYTIKIRIPGWAQGAALPTDLYSYGPQAELKTGDPVTLKVNGAPVKLNIEQGFAVLHRTWKKGDTIDLRLPMPVHLVHANAKVQADQGRVAIERGPILYCAEGRDNGGKVLNRTIPANAQFTNELRRDLLGGVTLIKGSWSDGSNFVAVPYAVWGNRGNNEMGVWLQSAN